MGLFSKEPLLSFVLQVKKARPVRAVEPLTEWQKDTRVRERLLRSGEISAQQVEAYLQGLEALEHDIVKVLL